MNRLKIRDDLDVRDVAHGVVDEVMLAVNQPAFRAGLAASMLSAAVLAKLTGKFLMPVVVSLMFGTSVEHLYGMAEDIHASLTCEVAPPDVLLFHGSVDCRGHKPGDCPETCSDAPGKV